jgi:flagella basal body P-ring formation protein FlgA
MAAQDLARGTFLTEDCIVVVPFPADSRPPTLADPAAVVGNYAVSALARGQYVSPADITAPDETKFIASIHAQYHQYP